MSPYDAPVEEQHTHLPHDLPAHVGNAPDITYVN
jgi:hypothetical protein